MTDAQCRELAVIPTSTVVRTAIYIVTAVDSGIAPDVTKVQWPVGDKGVQLI